MLKHMIKAQILNQITRSVNLLVRIRKIRLDNKSRGVSSLGGGCMIRASIAALRFCVWNVGVLPPISKEYRRITNGDLLQ
jgi:hypothetical protein